MNKNSNEYDELLSEINKSNPIFSFLSLKKDDLQYILKKSKKEPLFATIIAINYFYGSLEVEKNIEKSIKLFIKSAKKNEAISISFLKKILFEDPTNPLISIHQKFIESL